jgi:integrase
MRRGELVALRWEDVNLDASTVTVCRSVGKGLDGLHDKRPKSDAGRRTVELDALLVDVLRRHRQAQLERRLAIGPGWQDHDLVFCELDGAPVHPDRLSKRWSDLVRLRAPHAGVPVLRFHDLRHSHATQLLAANVRADVVTERLGHRSVAFTLQQYAHRWAGDQRTALARLRDSNVV